MNIFSATTPPLWRQILRQNFTHWSSLANFLQLDEEQRKVIITKKSFPLNLPFRLADKIAKGTLDDPILRQFLPTTQENNISAGFCADPVSDHLAAKTSKLLHKYTGRALLLCSSSCAMHCRYCFRQNFAYDTELKGFEKELALIKHDTSISELILSGGDPLSLSNRSLQELLQNLNQIAHIKHIRIHTRFPIGIPERIDLGLLALLSTTNKRLWVVLHINHPNELDDDVIGALQKLQNIGVVLLNQSVLLKGVNDDVETLFQLCQKLIDHGILPYYLHQLDQVSGTSHFFVARERGLELITELLKRLPGYAVPKYVQEVAGEPNKTPL